MRMFGVSLAVGLFAVGCGGAIPSSPDAAVLANPTVDAQALSSAKQPAPSRACAVEEVVLTAAPSTRYRRAYQVEATYAINTADFPCVAPIWTLDGRTGTVITTKNPFVVHVQSALLDQVLTVRATAPNGKSASQALKF